MNNRSFSEPVTYEDLIPAEHSRWNHEGVLFKVDGGLGRLVEKYGVDRNGDTHAFLMLGNKSLLHRYGYEEYCPTCASMLRAGLGQEQIEAELIAAVEQAQHSDQAMMGTLQKIQPMLEMLEDGYYVLTRIEMIPTDGEGNFFWDVPASKKIYYATADQVYYLGHYGDSTPKFILPSQSANYIDRERVRHYVNEIRQGKSMTGLAYYYDGSMSVLLDGHHRATAAYLENTTIQCLTIMRVNGYGYDSKRRPKYLYVAGEQYDLNLFGQPKRIYTFLEKYSKCKQIKLKTDEVEAILSADQEHKSVKLENISNDWGTRIYLDYKTIAFEDHIDRSKDVVEQLIDSEDEDADFHFEIIFKQLLIYEPERAIQIARYMVHHRTARRLNEEMFRDLASIDCEEVEDLFVHYLIYSDADRKDMRRRIANDYLNAR